MTTSPVKWGIISTADINRKVIPGAHASPKVDLVAVASRDRARAGDYAKKWGIPRACGTDGAMLGGEPERCWGEAGYGRSGTDGVFTGTMRFPHGVIATFDCGTALPNRDELEAIGSEGSLFVDDPWHCNNPVIEIRRADGVE